MSVNTAPTAPDALSYYAVRARTLPTPEPSRDSYLTVVIRAHSVIPPHGGCIGILGYLYINTVLPDTFHIYAFS